ncbi:beta-RFAP synthase [Caldisphaera lagunensis DSM 15908]|uniref:Beta-ribofuranosylaminobenzene 5'-phosphate synthase n=1 Tax=Caldisphaera lagunensis (strain DSM 15908 / JCM 11604 / ANMR 0165 / IC-154) TaxID=1056495 RepID=L0ADR3_CALLD|nr:beta-ribofuranosylaminobenzene 5'-phosphate synthase family protein [Caldisphaera lagunensis]AFZ71180.1 beta-RFAP synthase [Caldisphaera lagunensis DSM 15908]
MKNEVLISAPSHVHVGNIDLNGNLGRKYGTLGFSLESPRLVLRLKISEKDSINDKDGLNYISLFKQYLDCNKYFEAEILEDIPIHVGLGRTTALALSIGFGINYLCNKKASIDELAKVSNRGNQNSGLGVNSFKHGGFIIDGGVKGNNVAPLIFKGIVPDNLRIVVSLPEKPIKNILEIKKREDEILSNLPIMEESFSSYLSRIVLMKIMPSFIENDFKSFGEGLTEFNSSLGKYWKKYQDSIYCCKETEEIIKRFLDLGAYCACQSSWGPTSYGIFEYNDSIKAAEEIKKLINDLGGGKVWITKVDNIGAFLKA